MRDPSRSFDAEHDWRVSALATVNTHGDDRTAVLLLCAVLARLDRIEERLDKLTAEA